MHRYINLSIFLRCLHFITQKVSVFSIYYRKQMHRYINLSIFLRILVFKATNAKIYSDHAFACLIVFATLKTNNVDCWEKGPHNCFPKRKNPPTSSGQIFHDNRTTFEVPSTILIIIHLMLYVVNKNGKKIQATKNTMTCIQGYPTPSTRSAQTIVTVL